MMKTKQKSKSQQSTEDLIFNQICSEMGEDAITAKLSSPTTLVMTHSELSKYLGLLCSNHSMVENVKISHSRFSGNGFSGCVTTVTYYRKYKYVYVYERIYTPEVKEDIPKEVTDDNESDSLS